MLDHTKPCDQVFGIPGVSWSQDGCLYNAVGRPVTYRWEKTGEKDASGDPQDRLIVTALEDPPPVPVVVAASADELDNADWRHLKAMMMQYGEDYTTKEAAIAFLRGRKVAA